MSKTLPIAIFSALALAGCALDDTTPVAESDDETDDADDGAATLTADADELIDGDDAALSTLAACTITSTNINRSLVVRDATILAKFSFARVMSRIRATASIGTTQTNTSIFKTWMKTFGATTAAGDCNDTTIDPNKYGLTCPRAPELKLSTIDPFVATSGVSFRPVALFNRFDLAPASGANCGEYRIVYAMTSTNPNISGRAFIIFEAALPNPQPTLGAKGCLPIAQFWQNLTNDADVASRAAKLEKLYFVSGTIPGVRSVVHAANYGLATGTAAFTGGQIRTNFFVDFFEWHLREFKLRRTCTDPAVPSTCSLRVAHVTVKRNPAEELFSGVHTRSSTFRTAFPAQVPALARTNVNTLGMAISDTFNEFESVSQATKVVYNSVANQAMRDGITAKLQSMGSTLSVRNILDRATTQTCAGCHQASNNVALGGGLTWPASLGFVQIDEAGALSPALTTKFLPHRKTVLEKFITTNCTTTAAIAGELDAAQNEELTVGGAPVGGAN